MLQEYCHKCAVLMDMKCFVAMDVVGKSLVVYSRCRFERDTVISAWEKQWAAKPMVRRIFVDARFATISTVRSEQESCYSHKLQDVSDADNKVAE